MTAADAYANPTDFTYDKDGNSQTITDALGRVSDNDYDALNRLTQQIQNVGGINATTQFQYDARDNLTRVVDPKGLNTDYEYDGLDNQTKLTSPDTGVTTYTYDIAGDRKTKQDARGSMATYGYDAIDRLATITYGTTSLNVTNTYDAINAVCISGETFAIGRLTTMAMGNGNSTQYCYDRFGNVTRKVETINTKVFTVRYAYNLAGALTSLTYPDGAIADYVRDGQGQDFERTDPLCTTIVLAYANDHDDVYLQKQFRLWEVLAERLQGRTLGRHARLGSWKALQPLTWLRSRMK